DRLLPHRAVDRRVVRAEGEPALHAEGEGEEPGGAEAGGREAARPQPREVRAARRVEGGAALRGARADGSASRSPDRRDPRNRSGERDRGGAGGKESEKLKVKS